MSHIEARRTGDRKMVNKRTSAALLLCLAGAGAAAQDEGQRAALEEVIVTAERRSESLQDVSVSVSAFNEDMMERRQVTEILQVMNDVPNLVGNNNVGQSSATTFFIRGVGSTESIPTVDTTVGLYVDGVYIGRQGVNNFSLFDIDRVEVLRGPQGTLYGRNSSGGAVKIVTKQPGPELSRRIEFAYGEDDFLSARGSLNTQVGDGPLYFGGNFLVEQRDGVTENITLDRDVNDKDYMGGRASLRWEPSDSAKFTLIGDYSRVDENGLYGVNVLESDSAVPSIANTPTGDLFQIVSDEDIDNEAVAWGISLQGDWFLGNGVDLTSITAYRFTSQDYNLDISDRNPATYILSADTESTQFSQEFQLTGSLFDRGTWVAGLYYFNEQTDYLLTDDIRIAPFLVSVFDKDFDVDVESIAGFGEINYDLTDTLRLIAGVRVTNDRKKLDVAQTIGGAPGFDSASLSALGVDLDIDFTEVNPKVGLEFDVAEDVLLYGTYTQGFKSGGWQARVNNPQQFLNFEPEIVDSYEIGMKSTWLERRLRLNASIFYTDYQDLFNSVPGAGGTFLVATADAEITGLEIETTFRANQYLDLYGSFGFLDAEYKNLSTALQGTLGDELQRTPDLNAKVGASIDYPLANGRGLLFNVGYSYITEYFVNPQNTPASETGDFGLLDASIGLSFDDGKYEISLACRNCADEEYFDSILDFAGFGFSTVYTGPPRLVRASFRARF